MSTIERKESATLPPLVAGERLDRTTFHERYEAMPSQTRAELIGGVVHMPSPLSRDHARRNLPIALWTGLYKKSTAGVEAALNASVFLDDQSEARPDILMVIPPELGGQIREESGYYSGAPELVVETARSSRKIDLGPKFRGL